jgi:hypothetical protein
MTIWASVSSIDFVPCYLRYNVSQSVNTNSLVPRATFTENAIYITSMGCSPSQLGVIYVTARHVDCFNVMGLSGS